MARLIKDTEAVAEIAALDAFFETLAAKPERALYGPAHVFLAAHELGAIDTLLIADGLFRCADAAARRRWVLLTEEVEAGGGAARVFSSAHESGRQLGELTGVAATLRFPLPDLVDAELPPIEGMAGPAIDQHLNAFLNEKKTIVEPYYRTRTRLASRRTDENHGSERACCGAFSSDPPLQQVCAAGAAAGSVRRTRPLGLPRPCPPPTG